MKAELATRSSAPVRAPQRDWLWQATLFACIVGSRVPFLDAGYGSDPDAQRVIKAARTLRETGRYVASRLPGYPVQEYAIAALAPGGVWAVNGMSALMSGLCGVFFAGCLRAVGIRAASTFALALGSAAVPVVYINSTCAMDYVWALAWVLAAALAVLHECAWIAGVCLGLAIGTRVTSGAMLLPLALLSWARPPSAEGAACRRIAWLVLPALLVGGACYFPVFQRYGAHFLSHAPADASAPTLALIRRATRGVWGVVGCAALAWALVSVTCTHPPAAQHATHRQRTWVSWACVSAIVLYSIAYAQLPLEAAYLIPLVPFTVWLAAIWLDERGRWLFALLLCVSPFVDYQARFSLRGALMSDHAERLARAREAEQIIAAVSRLAKPAVIVAGARLSLIESLIGSESAGASRYVYLLKDAAHLEALRKRGFEVYVVDRATELYQARVNGLRLRDHGVRGLRLAP